MSKFKIKDSEGNTVNTIIADLEFVKSNYEFYEEDTDGDFEPSRETTERNWRNKELDATDKYMAVSDYPYKEQLAQWRQILRDWPSTENFPETRPVSFDEFLIQE